MPARGIRGAITVERNTEAAILEGTKEVIRELIAKNNIKRDDVVFAMFTTTRDLNAQFPAMAARQMGWTDLALLCGHEMEVPGSLQKVVRVLVVVNTKKRNEELVHVYLKGAVALRSDWNQGKPKTQ